MHQPLIKVKILVALIVTVLALIPLPCLAAGLPSPTTQTVNTIDAYQSVLTANDQLYIATFSLETTANTSANNSFIFRLKDAGIEIATVAPYNFYNNGNADGVVAFYFTADDPLLPVWNVGDIAVEFVGNPALTWAYGDPPSVTNAVVDSWNVGNTLISAKVRLLANQLENSYGVDMIELVEGILKLTAYGELYFETVIPNLRSLTPNIFSSLVSSPIFTTDNFTLVHKTTLESKLDGTILDATDAANNIGSSKMWVISLIWLIFGGALSYEYANNIGTVGLNYLIAIWLEVGSLGGFMPTEVGIGVGIIGGILLFYPVFFRNSSA